MTGWTRSSSASSPRAGGEAFRKGLEALQQYIVREGGPPKRAGVQEMPDVDVRRVGYGSPTRNNAATDSTGYSAPLSPPSPPSAGTGRSKSAGGGRQQRFALSVPHASCLKTTRRRRTGAPARSLSRRRRHRRHHARGTRGLLPVRGDRGLSRCRTCPPGPAVVAVELERAAVGKTRSREAGAGGGIVSEWKITSTRRPARTEGEPSFQETPVGVLAVAGDEYAYSCAHARPRTRVGLGTDETGRGWG